MNNTTNTKTYLRLTELTQKAGQLVETPILVNSDFIAVVSTSELADGQVHIIGETKVEQVTLLMLHNSRTLFVKETLEDIRQALLPANNGPTT